MASIIIKELYDSDDILDLVEKINFNFDQVLAAGGGPEGPAGPTGPQGPAGPQGIRGSEWFAATGATGIINVPTDGELRDNDFRLEDDGDVQYYDGGVWTFSGINLRGPAGPAGPQGDGSISTLHAQVSDGGQVVPNYSDTTGGRIRLNDHYIGVDAINDEEDYDSGIGYIDAGLDYAVIGYGNNSLVLGHYRSMFRDNGTGDPFFNNWPTEEKDVPMLIVAQNDYQDPVAAGAFDTLPEFKNGLAIGLNRSQGGAYSALYTGVDYYDEYDSFTRLGILNRNFDFGIQSVGHIEQRSLGSNKLRISAGYTRAEIKQITDVTQWSNLLQTNSYSEFKLGDNFAINDDTAQDSIVAPGISKQFILGMGNISISSNSSTALSNSLMSTFNQTFIGRNSNPDKSIKNANEILIANEVVSEQEARGDKYNNRRRIKTEKFSYRDNNNYRDLKLRFGQARKAISGSNAETAANFFYLGQGYDAPIIGYSAMNFRIPSGTFAMGGTGAASYMIPTSSQDRNMLGYDILDGFAPGGYGTNVDTDKSLTRLGIFPGFLNKQRDAAGNPSPSDPDNDNNFDLYIDEGHKKMPTGSLDLYGTVRIREYGLAENKEGFVAVNGGHGIVKWEESTKVGLPTGGIVMISELAMSKFNFFTKTSRVYGTTSTSTNTTDKLAFWLYREGGIGSTAAPNLWSAAFPGKGSDEWEGYYVCNGAVLADSRDIFARGAFSTQSGLNAYASNIPMPELQKNTEYFEDFGTFTDNYRYDSTVAGSGLISGNSTQFENAYINLGNRVAESYGDIGLSLLAPPANDSGYRVLLPNYFGRFPKQVFPDTETLALNNRDDAQPETSPGVRPPITSYYKQDGSGKYVLNDKYPLSSGFYTGGFPYVKAEDLPVHEHYVGRVRTVLVNSPGGASMTIYQTSERNASGNQPGPQPFSDTSGLPAHGTNRNVGDAGDYPDEWYINRDYDTDTFSSWENDETIDAIRNRSQKFHDPVFRGTYFVINLRGLRNPGRNNTIIPDFDFVAGVPYCGYRNTDTSANDASWYSVPSDLVTPAIRAGRGSAQWFMRQIVGGGDNTTLAVLTPSTGNEVLNQFERIYRNENTMHPYTIVDTSDGTGTANLKDIYSNIYTQPEL